MSHPISLKHDQHDGIAYRRFLEIIPGALVWITLSVSLVLSFLRPLWMMYFIIIFDLYWLIRIVYFTPYTIMSWWRFREATKRAWQPIAEVATGYDQTYHLIFLPTYKEDYHVIQTTIRALATCTYPAKRIIIVLAGEVRDHERFQEIAARAKTDFVDTFLDLLITEHPSNIPDEIPGKGSNLHYAAQTVLPHLMSRGLDPARVIVSAFDVDTIVHPKYLSCLTATYLSVPEPTRSSYQPVPLYNNNLWESPAAVRVALFGTTFWLMTEQARPEGMMTFSSHSMSLRMLIDVGFWQADVVSEDSRIFLQGLVHYHGHYRVTPIHLPVSMDTVMNGDYLRALVALYKQLRRWAWGVENFPYMVEAFSRDPLMSRWTKAKWIFKQLEGMYTWATAPALVFFLGYVPFIVAPESLHDTVLFQTTPFTLQWMMRLAMIGLFVSAALSFTLLPPRPRHLRRPIAYSIILLQWALLPITFIIFGAIPAIDAQTRFMLGKRLGFNVSPKRATSK